MQLTDEQKREVATWIAGGAKLSEVQQRLDEQFGVRLTYMEARFLVDDLKLVPQEKPEETPAKEAKLPGQSPDGAEEEPFAEPDDLSAQPQGAGKVQVSVDKIVKPGALVSGKVTFSDGVNAEWYLDQMGRFGLVPPQPGYRPTPEDLTEFRVILERELARQGL